jgi:putative endonuclease
MNNVVRNLMSRILGQRGERAAARYLRHQGMKILVRGYRARSGEIDLIARDGNTLVFVEVKARRRGTPAEAVTPGKERRITLAALRFMRRYRVLDARARFDIVAIVWSDDKRPPQVEHIRNAFDAVGRWQMFR